MNGANALTLKAGSTGGINFSGAIGGSIALASISATGKTIILNNVSTTGLQNYTGATSTTLNGNYITAGGSFTVAGPALLAGTATVDTTNAGLSAEWRQY